MMAAVEGQSTESMTVLGLRKLAQATDAVKDRHCLSETHAKTSDPGQAAADYKSYTEPHRGIPCAPEARPWSSPPSLPGRGLAFWPCSSGIEGLIPPRAPCSWLAGRMAWRAARLPKGRPLITTTPTVASPDHPSYNRGTLLAAGVLGSRGL